MNLPYADRKHQRENYKPDSHQKSALFHLNTISSFLRYPTEVGNEMIKIVDSKGTLQNYNQIKQHYEQYPAHKAVNKLVLYLKEHKYGSSILSSSSSRKETERLAKSVQQGVGHRRGISRDFKDFQPRIAELQKDLRRSAQYIEIESLIA